jgi:hypothetical protein
MQRPAASTPRRPEWGTMVCASQTRARRRRPRRSGDGCDCIDGPSASHEAVLLSRVTTLPVCFILPPSSPSRPAALHAHHGERLAASPPPAARQLAAVARPPDAARRRRAHCIVEALEQQLHCCVPPRRQPSAAHSLLHTAQPTRRNCDCPRARPAVVLWRSASREPR